MNILGINFLSEASAALVQDGKVVSAASEERFNRIKLFHGYPEKAIDYVLKSANLKMSDIDVIATTGKSKGKPDENAYNEKRKAITASNLPAKIKQHQLQKLKERQARETFVLGERTPANIKRLESLGPKVEPVGHHLAHVAAAYYSSGFNDCTIITCDGWGENASNILCKTKDGEIEEVSHSNTFDSLGYYYGSLTKFLGFRPHRHEGKILGLAAFGNPESAAPIMRKMVGFDKERQRFLGKMEEGIYVPFFENDNLSRAIKLGQKTDASKGIFTKEDVSAGLQHVLEEVVLEYVNNLDLGNTNVAVAGGVFANVKLNQRILELPQVKNIFVYPNMGDGGLAVGSALLVHSRIAGLKPTKIEDVYLGPEFSEEEILKEIKKEKQEFEKHSDIEGRVAELLAENKVVARFNGRMEWGPRALGNRSILYSSTDKTVNDWLNRRLSRTEWMPFAPVTMKENAGKCYLGYKEEHATANFMTITYNCTEEMKKTQPAVVHVDGTARPQIIEEKVNQSYYKIKENYYKLTGLPSMINTSFNMHEEPIVCTPFDAIRSFKVGHLDYLAIGNFLLENKAATDVM
jgi:carbamoyltransferase